jgi:hypothetical protein
LVNHSNPTSIEKKYVENSIYRSLERENTKKRLNKSSNPSDKLNQQFHSPTNSDQGVVVGLKKSNKKSKNIDFEINENDFYDAADKQAIKDLDEDKIHEGESFEF